MTFCTEVLTSPTYDGSAPAVALPEPADAPVDGAAADDCAPAVETAAVVDVAEEPDELQDANRIRPAAMKAAVWVAERLTAAVLSFVDPDGQRSSPPPGR